MLLKDFLQQCRQFIGCVTASRRIGFPLDLLHFLDELSKNNNRDWFTANKDRYERELRQTANQLQAESVHVDEVVQHDASTWNVHLSAKKEGKLPLVCLIDKNFARCCNYGLKRTQVIAEGADYCDFRMIFLELCDQWLKILPFKGRLIEAGGQVAGPVAPFVALA